MSEKTILSDVVIGQSHTRLNSGPQHPVQLYIRLTGHIDTRELQRAWKWVLRANADSIFASTANAPSNGHGHLNRNPNGNGHASSARTVRVIWQEHDLQGLTSEEARKWIASFLETDHLQLISDEFPLKARCALIRLNQGTCELVCSFHPFLKSKLALQRALDNFT